MKTIIAGSRTFNDAHLLKDKLDSYRKEHTITEIVSGGAAGADARGEAYAILNGINIKMFHADWEAHGKAAGPIRNRQMAEYADVLIAVWDGQSKGTKNMIEEMNKRKKPVFLIWIGGPIEAQGAKNELVTICNSKL
jgi:hypothetical protein